MKALLHGRTRPQPHVMAMVSLVLGAVMGLDAPAEAKALALVVGFSLIILGGPLAGITVVFAALPLWMVQLHIGGTSWSPLELALMACGSSVAVAALVSLLSKRTLPVLATWLPERDLLVLVAALAILGGLSLLWVAESDLRSDSMRSMRRVILEPLMVIPALVFARRMGQERSITNWLGIPAIAVALLALAQIAGGRSTVDIGGFARPIGTFTHPNNLAFYLERAIWFVPICPLVTRIGDKRIRTALLGFVALACLVTLSRGAALALLVGGCVFYREHLRRHRLMLPLVAVPVIVFAFGTRLLADTSQSTGSREVIWRSAISMIRDRPFTGVGLDQFFGQYGRRYIDPAGWAERYTSHPHNIVLDFWLSLGIAGFAILWLYLELVYRRARASLASAPNTVHRAAVAMLLAGLAHGLIDNSFFLPDLATFAWIGFALGIPQDIEHAA